MKILSAEYWAPVFKYQGVYEIKYIHNLGKYGHLLLDWRGAPILVHAKWILALTVVHNERRLSHYLFSSSKNARVSDD